MIGLISKMAPFLQGSFAKVIINLRLLLSSSYQKKWPHGHAHAKKKETKNKSLTHICTKGSVRGRTRVDRYQKDARGEGKGDYEGLERTREREKDKEKQGRTQKRRKKTKNKTTTKRGRERAGRASVGRY